MGDYNNFAEIYRKKTFELEAKSRKHFYSLLPFNLKNSKILDIGCGSGQDAVYYNRIGAKVFGIDISEKEIEMAENLKVGIFSVGDMNKLPFNDSCFDQVTSFYALQASQNVERTIIEMIRVVKKGGFILIQTKHPFRTIIEGWKNNNKLNYYTSSNVTSRILKNSVILDEPSHTIMDYLSKEILNQAELILLEEHSDFPASEEIIKGLIYPTYMILKFRKK
nr:hypothetical protein [Nanoarchaeum sp.]